MKKSRIVLVLCMMVVIAVASVAGTIAWLTDTTEPVTNTFTPTDVDITLTETWNTDTNNDNKNDAWTVQMIPGVVYTKDPVVTVEGSDKNVDIYLFVKVEENACAQYLNYELNLEGWTKLDVEDTVYYREVEASTEDQSWNLLVDNQVSVKGTLTKENMPDEDVTMVFTAYAIQVEGFDMVEDAWDVVSGN